MPWLQLQSGLGLAVLMFVAWALSENRRAAFSWRLVGASLALQIGLALLLLEVPPARSALYSLNQVVDALSSATQAGTSFVFGFVGGGAPPFEVTKAQNLGSLAFQALPLVLVISALSALLWHWRVLPAFLHDPCPCIEGGSAIGGDCCQRSES